MKYFFVLTMLVFAFALNIYCQENGCSKEKNVQRLISIYERNEEKFLSAARDSIHKYLSEKYERANININDVEIHVLPQLKIKENLKLQKGDDIYPLLTIDTLNPSFYIILSKKKKVLSVCASFIKDVFFCQSCIEDYTIFCERYEKTNGLSDVLMFYFKYEMTRFAFVLKNRLYFKRKYPDEENYSNELNEFFWNRYTEEEVNKWLERENKEE